MRQQLERAQEQLASAQTVAPAEDNEADHKDSERDHLEPVPERVRVRVCLPVFADGFAEALERVPDNLAAQAVIMAGRLAAGDKHAWNGCRLLKQTQGVMRQRLGRSHRLFFRCHERTLEFIDLIQRQDFETWVRKYLQA